MSPLRAVLVLCVLGAACTDLSGTEQPDKALTTARGSRDNETEVWELLENDTHHGTDGHSPTLPPVTEPTTLTHPVTSTLSPPSQPPVLVRELESFDVVVPRSIPVLVTSASSLCVCNLLVSQCDVNCCCDPDCTAADFSVFSGCSVSAVTGDEQLCLQDAVLYSINSTTSIPQMVTQTVQLVNPNVFCIQTANYQPALSFITPDEPTEANFDSLLREFGENQFNVNPVLNSVVSAVSNRSRYEYGVPILTSDSYLKLPFPLGTSICTDNNPIGFLQSQNFTCTRNVQLENCSVPILTLGTYTGLQILPVPNSKSGINVTVQSVTLQSVDGTLVRGNFSDKTPFYNASTNICSYVVLGGSYSVIYTANGQITSVLASFILGTISSSLIQQSFQISFTEEGTTPVALSGNPGYVFGMPLVAGFRLPQSGIIKSTNRFGQLTLLRSLIDQSCLTEEGKRAAVLFGYDMMSGCKLRLNSLNYTVASFCQLAGVTILNALKGQQFPEYVAQFGNSQPENVLDWVTINTVSPGEQASAQAGMCKIPVSLKLEVRWTKFGSLVNPQAQIVNVTETISYAFIPDNLGSDRTIQISTAVTFLDVSQAASAGYKAQPTIDAKLPFDFFYPFV